MDKLANAYKVASVVVRYLFGMVQGLFWCSVVAVGIVDTFTNYEIFTREFNDKFVMLTLLIWGCVMWAVVFKAQEDGKL